MKCESCGRENTPGDRFCGMCGRSLVVTAGGDAGHTQMGVRQMPAPEPTYWPQAAPGGTENVISRVFGGMGWLVVSLGTFIIAFGWLGTVDYSYYEDQTESLRMIGYGVIVLAISGLFFSVKEFLKSPP